MRKQILITLDNSTNLSLISAYMFVI